MDTKNKTFSIKDNISILEANKRECFDGMRAYHQSELSHLQHTLQVMWRSIFPVVFIPNGVLLAQGPVTLEVIFASFATLLISIGILVTLFCTAKTKIEGDNKMYNVYGKDYTKTCDLLHLSKEIHINDEKILLKDWSKGKPGEGKGYEKSILIIANTAWLFVSIPLVYFFCITLYYLATNN